MAFYIQNVHLHIQNAIQKEPYKPFKEELYIHNNKHRQMEAMSITGSVQ